MTIRRVLGAVLLLLLVDTVSWAVLCRQLEHGVRQALAAAPEAGSITAGSIRWGGWPFAAAIDLSPVAAALLPGLAWRAETARVELSLFHPTTLWVQGGRSQSIEARDRPSVPLTLARAVVQLDLTGAAPPHAIFRALEATLPAGSLKLAAADLAFPGDGIAADLTGLALPGVAVPIAAIHLRATIRPALPASANPEATARAWRQTGGQVDIAEATLQWNMLEAAGTGTITLDDRLQPKADGTVQASGLPQLLDDLVHAGVLAPAQAGAAKAVITVLAAPSGGARVALPISLVDGVLRLAGFPLLRLPPLAWN